MRRMHLAGQASKPHADVMLNQHRLSSLESKTVRESHSSLDSHHY